ncbi:MAG: IS3 family transposase [Flavobacterium sp.]
MEQYIRYYNNERIKSNLKGMSPINIELIILNLYTF